MDLGVQGDDDLQVMEVHVVGDLAAGSRSAYCPATA